MLSYFFIGGFLLYDMGQESPGPCQPLSEAGRSVVAGTGTRAEWSFQILVFLGLWERPVKTPAFVFSCHCVPWTESAGQGSQLPQSPRRGWAKWVQQNPSSDPSSHSTERAQLSPPQPESGRTSLNSKRDRGCRGNNHKSVSLHHDEETVFSFNPLERLPIACPLPLEQPPCAFAPTAPSVPSPQTVAPLLKGEAWVLLL